MKTSEIISELEKQPSNIARVAAQRLRELTQWRPMETAPSETNIVVKFSNKKTVKVGWIEPKENPLSDTETVVFGDYEDAVSFSDLKGWLPLPEVGE